MEWNLQDAKNRFSEVVELALTKGPQTVKRRGKVAVVVVSAEHYRTRSKPKESLVELLRRCPLRADEIDALRSNDLPREIEL